MGKRRPPPPPLPFSGNARRNMFFRRSSLRASVRAGFTSGGHHYIHISFSKCCCRGCLLWDNTHAISKICGDIGIPCCSIYRRNYLEENNFICITNQNRCKNQSALQRGSIFVLTLLRWSLIEILEHQKNCACFSLNLYLIFTQRRLYSGINSKSVK